MLADHPVIYYRLDEGSGSVAADSSGNHNDGTYSSGAAFGTSGAPINDPDTAITNPSGAFYQVPMVTQSGANLAAGSSARTLEMWYRSTNPSQAWLMLYGDAAGTHYFGL